jgi:hypothetical protein
LGGGGSGWEWVQVAAGLAGLERENGLEEVLNGSDMPLAGSIRGKLGLCLGLDVLLLLMALGMALFLVLFLLLVLLVVASLCSSAEGRRRGEDGGRCGN